MMADCPNCKQRFSIQFPRYFIAWNFTLPDGRRGNELDRIGGHPFCSRACAERMAQLRQDTAAEPQSGMPTKKCVCVEQLE